jgi:hypothetical protein
MITPTVGRVVWVIRPFDTVDIKQPEAAFITYVQSDSRYINVAGFNGNGDPFHRIYLRLLQDDEAKPEGDFACWMPYQKGQAAKHDHANAVAALIKEGN